MRYSPLLCLVGCGFSNSLLGGGDDVMPGPTIEFMDSMQSVNETVGNLSVNAMVVLSEPAARGFSLTFNITGTAGAAELTIITGSPVSVPAGATSASITIRINDDTMIEGSETVVLTLSSTTLGMIGAQATHTISIVDNDAVCFGEGTFATCFPAAPTGAHTLPAMLNTDTSPSCTGPVPIGWSQQGQPDACFVVGASINVTTPVSAFGSRPLVLVGANAININGLLDVSSHRDTNVVGPGSPSTACVPPTPPVLNGSDSSGGGGGAGGSYFASGGNGGTGKSTDTGGTAAAATTTTPIVLRAGCDGQRGRMGDVMAGVPGRGGGVVYVVSGGNVTIGATGAINASGSAGTNGGDSSGGSGAGSGGTIKLHAPTLNLTIGSALVANGGGGAAGADDGGNAMSGRETDMLTPTVPPGGGIGPANGGNGFPATAAQRNGTNGSPASQNAGGGGGGGGGGLVESNQPLTNATVSAAKIVP